MSGVIRDWRYRAQCRRILRHYSDDGGGDILDSDDAFNSFCEGLPTVKGVGAVLNVGSIGDTLKQLLQWAFDHREEIIKFIMEIIALFPKSPAPA